MSASYHETLDRPLDWIRKDLGDAQFGDDEDAALLSDQHILATLAQTGTRAAATAELADELAVRFAQEPSSVGLSGLTVSWAQRVTAWQALATRMREAVAAAGQGRADAAAASGDAATVGVW